MFSTSLLLLTIMISFSTNTFFIFFLDKLSTFMILLCILCFTPIKFNFSMATHKSSFFTSQLALILFFSILFFSFITKNMFIFFILFENALAYLMVLVMVSGYQPERISANFYLFNYTLISSFPFFITITALMNFFILDWFSSFSTLMTYNLPNWMLWSCCVMILVKIPIYFFHLWLPKVHVEASTAGSMILAAIILKLGGYIMIRLITSWTFLLEFKQMLFNLGLLSLIISASLTLFQTDMKSLVAYSSIFHMSLCLNMACMAVQTSPLLLVLFISHGLSSNMLFLFSGMFFYSFGTRLMFYIKNSFSFSFLMSMILLLTLLFNLGIPLSLNFIFEFLAIFTTNQWMSFSMLIFFPALMISLMYFLLISTSLIFSPKKNSTNFFMKMNFSMNLTNSLFIFVSILGYFFFLSI
uniref:NADH-ubiquinone oxidoreductase chain 4 n=1 Tax=Gnathostomula paradoxa TaxID=66783 RepID=A0A0F6Q0V5_9BILA|nr:NADH dehydrogenase subunit 4 [Gnathostomula paradoxa]AKD00035.1 NADH dehydrogenase subunit 4 [Gnathostomula paradoxa]